jgi:hypothetical protein
MYLRIVRLDVRLDELHLPGVQHTGSPLRRRFPRPIVGCPNWRGRRFSACPRQFVDAGLLRVGKSRTVVYYHTNATRRRHGPPRRLYIPITIRGVSVYNHGRVLEDEWRRLVAYTDDLREHEQVLLRLLDEMGRSLARQERLLEEIENRHVQIRNSWIQEGAEEPFGPPDQQALVNELQRELERGRDQELELHEILDVLKRRCELEDRLLDELESHLPREHRDQLLRDLLGRFERRDRLLEDIALLPFQVKRDRLAETMQLLPELERLLFEVVERHLVRLHNEGD